MSPRPPRIRAVVPTLGKSPWLVRSLEALRRQEGVEMEIVLVDQGEIPVELPAGLADPVGLVDQIVRPGRNLGFAGGTNAGIAGITESAGDFVATVNDDALVEPGWAAALAEAMAATGAAAAQGTNVDLGDPPRIDGCGLEWNRWWQAVQIRHGEPVTEEEAEPREVFGVSATAALYSRAALEAVSREGKFFDPELVSYYEDVELAGRLQRAGFSALWVPGARALHAGSTTAGANSLERWRLIYGNRYLAAARWLGKKFPETSPLMIVRDLLDLARAGLTADRAHALGITAGWRRALRLLPGFAHRGDPPPAHGRRSRPLR